MQITNDYASTLDLFGTESTSANKTEEEHSGTTLFGLDGDRVVLPGHGQATTLDRERMYNPISTDGDER